MDLLLWLSGIVASAFFSWLFTHLYYKRALHAQQMETGAQVGKLTELVTLQRDLAARDAELLRQRRIEQCIVEHGRAGTPVPLIDTYNDLSPAQKGELLDSVFLRLKGRKPKVNKYRDEGAS